MFLEMVNCFTNGKNSKKSSSQESAQSGSATLIRSQSITVKFMDGWTTRKVWQCLMDRNGQSLITFPIDSY